MTNDDYYKYGYDAEGHTVQAMTEGSATVATYVYNALNQRVQAVVGSMATDYVFNAAGQRVSEWNGTTFAQLKGKYYWGGRPVAYYANGATHFEHQNWLGTERMRTTYNGGVEGSYISLPFGDGYAASGTDGDANHYAQLDHDSETNTDHAQFRQYSNTQGRLLSPDPYSGSYDASNPQSMNRYAYALNNPLSNIDPSGHDSCMELDGATIDYCTDGGIDCNPEDPATCYQTDPSGPPIDPSGLEVPLELAALPSTTPPNVVFAPNQLSFITDGNTVTNTTTGQTVPASVGQWQLDPPATGQIVQQVTITDPSGNQIIPIYWEKWDVTVNSQGYATYAPTNTDTFANAPSGSTFTTSAAFYPGLQVPTQGDGAFITPNPATGGGQLPSTTVNPNLPNPSLPTTNSSLPVNRTWTAQ